MTWTLINDTKSVTGELFTWNITRLTRSSQSQGEDRCEVTIVVDKADVPIQISAEDRVRIQRDGAAWYAGIVIGLSPSIQPDSESISLTIAGPWYFLQEFEYQQRWKVLRKPSTTPDWYYSPHVFLNRIPAFTSGVQGIELATSAATITEILQYVLDQCTTQSITAPFQIGSILPTTSYYIPVDEAQHITAAEAIRRILRWHPDAVLWANHLTNPPTLNITRHDANMPAVNLDIGTLAGLEISPAYERQRPAVVVYYTQKGSYDGNDWISQTVDRWPLTPTIATGREMGSLSFSINLIGSNITFMKAVITSQAFNGAIEPANGNWWKQKIPNLATLGDLVVYEHKMQICTDEENGVWVDAVDENLYGYELIAGQIAPWMKDDNGVISWGMLVRAVGKYSYSKAVSSVTSEIGSGVPLQHQFTLTNLGPGTYSLASIAAEGDPIPQISSASVVGIARYLQQYLSQLHYVGSATIVGDEVVNTLDIGKCVNVTGSSNADWSNMRALIQSVSWNIDSGYVSIQFGPPEHLGAADLVDLLRCARDRGRFTNGLLQNEGKL